MNDVKFDEILQTYQESIYRYCFHMLLSKEDAEDVVQEVFINLYKYLINYKKDHSIRALLYKLSYNSCINVIRKRKYKNLLKLKVYNNTYYDNVSDYIDENYIWEELEIALSKLSIVEKNLIILKVVEEMTYKEISVVMELKEATLRKKYERTKQKLFNILNKKCGDISVQSIIK